MPSRCSTATASPASRSTPTRASRVHSDTYFGRVAASALPCSPHLIERELAPEIIGTDPFLIRGIRDRLWTLTDYHGTTGFALFGIAAIDLALWDLMGKAVGQPVWRLLGRPRDRVPAYAMVGWLELDERRPHRRLHQSDGAGVSGVKMKVGCPTLAEDVRRIEAVRVCDRRRCRPDGGCQSGVLGRRGPSPGSRSTRNSAAAWFEEPIRADDIDGHVALAERLQIPIATGENRYGIAQFRDLFARGGVGVVQPDLRRAGGLTECLEIGLMAHGFGIPVRLSRGRCPPPPARGAAQHPLYGKRPAAGGQPGHPGRRLLSHARGTRHLQRTASPDLTSPAETRRRGELSR